MARWAQGIFVPKNTHKYIGKHEPKYRSGWEWKFMQFCDNNENILHWASEAITVPYLHPLTGKKANYIPDFFIIYKNKFGQKLAEVVEIKPKKQSMLEGKKISAKDRAIVAVNHAKWAAANAYCQQNNLIFRVLTESELFYNGQM